MYYIVSSGGLILKGFNSDDKVYMEGDLADPMSIVGEKYSGDLLSIGDSSILVGDRDELREYLVARPERLEKFLQNVEEDLRSCSESKGLDLDGLVSILVSMKQHWLKEYPPLLFGEKSLYRKGIKLIERREYPSAQEVLKSYLEQYQNSPLSRPVKLYYSLSCFLNNSLDLALTSILEIVEGEADEIAGIARFFACRMGLLESGFKFLYKGPDYSSNLFRNLRRDSRKIRKTDSDKIVVEEGKRAGSAIFLLKGEMILSKRRENENSVLFSLKSPNSIGEVQLLAKSKWDTTVVVRGNSEYVLLDRSRLFQHLIHKSPQDGFKMVEYILGYMRQSLIS